MLLQEPLQYYHEGAIICPEHTRFTRRLLTVIMNATYEYDVLMLIPFLDTSNPSLTHSQVGQILSVRNGFLHNYRRGGYRDVKLFVNLRQHICEIQLHLSSFYDMKDDQHVVYEWSRRLNVTVEMKAENLFQNMGPDILQQMIKLARVDWHSTGGALPFLLAAVGKYGESEQLFRKASVRWESVRCGVSLASYSPQLQFWPEVTHLKFHAYKGIPVLTFLLISLQSYDSLNARMEWKEATFGRNSKEWNLSARFAAMSMNNLASVLASKVNPAHAVSLMSVTGYGPPVWPGTQGTYLLVLTPYFKGIKPVILPCILLLQQGSQQTCTDWLLELWTKR